MNKSTLKIFYRGVDSFNNKDYYDAHEYFEEIWTEHELEDRVFIQALIQLSVAYFHITNSNKNGAMGLFKKSIKKLDLYIDTIQIISNINDIIKAAHDSYEYIQQIDDTNLFNWNLAPSLEVENV